MNPIPQPLRLAAMSRPVLWATQILLEAARGLWLERQRRRAMHAARRELERLDAQTLRDLALHECEAASVAAEFVGLAPASRRRIAPVPHGLRWPAPR
jgi:hypothetical protein